MKDIVWAKNMLKDEKAQEELESKVSLLLEAYFKDKSDYAKEKFVRSFGELFIYLENNLLKDRGVHPSQFKNNPELLTNPTKAYEKQNEVSKLLVVEINRQYRHFTTFLGEF